MSAHPVQPEAADRQVAGEAWARLAEALRAVRRAALRPQQEPAPPAAVPAAQAEPAPVAAGRTRTPALNLSPGKAPTGSLSSFRIIRRTRTPHSPRLFGCRASSRPKLHVLPGSHF